ncbi:MAG: S8 family serine peptidase [Candidatus Eisenbacteria bacterium]
MPASSTVVASAGIRAGDMIQSAGRGTLEAVKYADAGEIQLGNGIRFDPLRDGEPPMASKWSATASTAGGRGGYLVQFAGPIEPGQREQLEAAGATVVTYVPRYALVVRMGDAERAQVEGLSFVRWVGAYQPAYKLSEELASATGPATLVVLLYPDADLVAERGALEAMGGTIVEATDSGRNKIIRVTMDAASSQAIASRGDVAWVEPYHQPVTNNGPAQWVVQTNVTNNRRVWDMGLHGEGQVVHTSDSGIRTSHNQFRDDAVPITAFGDFPTHRKIIAYRAALPGIVFGDALGASYHGTHTAGSICGDDSPFAADVRDGQALKAKIFFTDAGNLTNSITAPGDLNLLFDPPYQGNAGGAARVSSNSWGAASNNYDVNAMTVDQFMWDHKDFAIFYSNGNTFTAAQVGSPAVAKNCVSVGATQNGAAAGVKASFSSEGPAEDGRRKPTICAPGDGVTPLSGVSSANGANDTGYKGLAGTSMASPTAAGAATLIRQYLTDGWYPTGAPNPANGFSPSAALIKAMAISSTDDDMPGHSLPDNAVGWGRMKLDNVLFFPGDAIRTALVDDDAGLTTGQFAEYQFYVTNTAVPLKITLCWTDREGNPASLTQLVNDLNLTVTDPNGVPYLGNVLTSSQSVPGGVADILNVEEGVRLNVPLAGRWTIRVTGSNVPFGPQPFAIAATGGVGNVSGLLSLDRHVYGRADQIQVRVDDADAVGPVTVNVSSNSEPTPEALTLSGSGGVFTGSIATSVALASSDGDLSVSHGDAVTVTYADAAPVGLVTATAAVDFDGPVISGVGANERGEAQLVGWTTNVAATSRVFYGTTTALGQMSTAQPELVLSHAVLLSGLQPETEYFYDVESTDQGGNLTRDDNSGSHYRFVSGGRGDILVVIGDGSFPATNTYVDALLERGWSPAVLEGGTISNPLVGNRTAGLRSFTAVWWQVGQEQYPPVPDAARDSLDLLMAGGGRLAMNGHDIAWAFTDPASGQYTPARVAWLENTLHARFLEDPAAWVANQGVAGDPISDPYVAGVPYVGHRQGASGDEIELVPGSGSGAYVWRNTDATPNNIAVRWESGTTNGNPADAVWGGTPSRLLYNTFEWAQLVNSADRVDILDRSLLWLIGNDHPDVTVVSPNGGEVIAANSIPISWTETPYGGATIIGRSIRYSTDGGRSWQLVTSNAGPSPYVWDVSSFGNGNTFRVRVDVADNGSPALNGRDASNGDFSIQRVGGDNLGPVIVAGSVRSNPNPMDNRTLSFLHARVSDAGTGGSSVTGAEWSQGEQPAPGGTGQPMDGNFGGSDVEVSGRVRDHIVPAGLLTFWVRGRDEHGNWGPASPRTLDVNGDATVSVIDAGPMSFALDQNAPNPVSGAGTSIRYALPRPGHVELTVFGIQGERVRTVASEFQPAGRRSIFWDRRDDSGRPVPSGVYFYKLQFGNERATRKMVVVH